MSSTSSDDLLTCEEAAEYMHVPVRFIRRLIAERRVAFLKVGRYVRLRRRDLDRFLEAGRVEAS
jgi:excisionase family DNA binding protein